MSADRLKQAAAEAALAYVEDGMRLGLGTGSTAAKFVALVGEKVKAGLEVTCVPTSEATRTQAESLGIPLATLEELPELDLTVDGADELDDQLRLIKGGGGALLREKIVACASQRMVVIADGSKHVTTLGAFPLPVEVEPFGLGSTERLLRRQAEGAGCHGEITLRRKDDGSPFVTDGGKYILDCAFGQIPDPEALAEAFCAVPGIVEHGLFLGIASVALVATPEGVHTLTAEGS